MCRAQVKEAAYLEVAKAKVEVERQLRDSRSRVSRIQLKLEGFNSREENLRDLRREVLESEERAEIAEASAAARCDDIRKELAEVVKQRDGAQLHALDR